MTPEEFQTIQTQAESAIEALRRLISEAHALASEAPLPDNLRPANADDIKVGAIVWYKRGDEGPFWQIVERPLYYGDAFKAYTAEDGCRYGLDDAWIEVEP